jgi:hypothetical protein
MSALDRMSALDSGEELKVLSSSLDEERFDSPSVRNDDLRDVNMDAIGSVVVFPIR